MSVLELAFVAYPVADLARASEFYESVLGLKREEGYETPKGPWIEYAVGASTLAIGCHPSMKPSTDGVSAGLEVDDFDKTIEQLKTQNITFLMEPFQTPVCRMAIILDPDGNKVIIHKRNPGQTPK